MTLIRPINDEERYRMLGRLAVGAAKRLGFTLEAYSPDAISDTSGAVHWMYNFTPHESRIYRTTNGMQRLYDINVQGSSLDLDDIDRQIQKAVLDLNTSSLAR